MTPTGWRAGKMLDFFELQRGFDLTEKDAVPGIVPVISSSGFAYFHNIAKVRGPGVVTGRKGSVGPVHFVCEDFWPHDTTLWVKNFKGNEPKYVKSFLEFMRLEQFDEASSVPTLNRNNIHGIKCLFPPVDEQSVILAVLDIWQHAIDLTDQLVAEKQLRRKGLMQQILSGKRRLPGFTGEWQEYEIGKLFREVNRPVEWDDDELYDLISVRRRSGGLFHRESLYGRQILTKNLKTAHTGDFLISKMQVLHGATGLVTSEFDSMKVSGSYISLVPRKPERISTEFFSYFSQLPSFYHLTFLSSYGVHIEKMTFNTKWFMRSKISIPPTAEEQHAIANFIRTADRELELLQVKADVLREQKKGLMQQLLTGKKRVKV